jgi:hypothetical protein
MAFLKITQALKSCKPLGNCADVPRRYFADFSHLRLGRSLVQPLPQLLDRGRCPMREHLDAAVRQVTRNPADIQSSRLEAGGVTEKYALNLPKDEKTADDVVQCETRPQCGCDTGASACWLFALASAAAA